MFSTTFFAYRVPALSIAVLTGWADGVEAPRAQADDLAGAIERDRALLRARLHETVAQPQVLGAISVASPDLLDAARDRPDDTRVEAALVRYLSRMASRPTPFGLFAACGVGRIARSTEISVPAAETWRRHTRLDGDYLDRVVRARIGEVRATLRFRPNDSLYVVGDRCRYVQTRLDKLQRTHHLAEVASSPHLQAALLASRDGATSAAIAESLAVVGLDGDRATSYVDKLIDAQVLSPTVTVAVTGSAPLDVLIDDLDGLGDDKAVGILRAVRDELAELDAEGIAVVPARHAHVGTVVSELAAPEAPSRLLQVDLTIPAGAVTVAQAVVDDVVRAVELLRRIQPVSESDELAGFRDAFAERYEGREVPLLEALDGDLGVGFGTGGQGGDPAPLLKGLPRPAGERRVTIGGRERRLLDLLARAWSTGAREIVLSQDDIEVMEQRDPPPLPVAMGVMATLARTDRGVQVVVSGAHGPSGANLLGRFCHADPELDARVREHLRAEEAWDPEAIYAEIVHLPSGLLSNVLVRPVLREWELEWLGRSGAPGDRRLPASDLQVSLRHGEFVLRSRRLDRRVVPRLTSAHNWSGRSPAVYRFLAAVQSQGTRGASWTWAPLPIAAFTPRVRWGNVVLALATWTVPGAELRALNETDLVRRWNAVREWQQARGLPRWICLVDGDNKLTIDLDNVLSVETFVRATRVRDEVRIEELYPSPDQLVAAGPDGPRTLELVIPLVRSAAPSEPEPVAAQYVRFPDARFSRSFPPGSEWTYLKLYTGTASADTLLRDVVAPAVRDLVAGGAADRWFFLRYDDPRFHLRVRVHGDPSAIRPRLDRMISAAVEAGLTYDVQIATYEREVERYGGPDGIDVAERIFQADSDAVVDLLARFERGERGLDERWRIGLVGTYALVRDLGLDLAEQASLARRSQQAFEAEFSADAQLRKAVAEKVRAERAACAELLDATGASDHPLAPGIAVIERRSAALAPLAVQLSTLAAEGRLARSIADLAGSYTHMWLDRLCRSENRFHEYVTYAILAPLLREQLARART